MDTLKINMSLFFIVLMLMVCGINAQTCCSTCAQTTRDKYSWGLEALFAKSQIHFYLSTRNNFPISMLASAFGRLPSNVTDYFYLRSKDNKERVDNQLMRYDLQVDKSVSGIQNERDPYQELHSTFVKMLIKAMQITSNKNYLNEDPDFITFQDKLFTQLAEKYDLWLSGSPLYRYPDIVKRATIAIMAILMAQLSSYGPDEQNMVKLEMESIYDACFDGSIVSRSEQRVNFCNGIPIPSTKWPKSKIKKNLPGPKSKKKPGNLKKLTYATRSKTTSFLDMNDYLSYHNVGYIYRWQKKYLVHEETEEYDLEEKTIEPILGVRNKGGISFNDEWVLNLIRSIQIPMLFSKVPGFENLRFNADKELRAKWLSLTSYAVATVYTPFLAQKYGDQFYDMIKSRCPVTCNSEC